MTIDLEAMARTFKALSSRSRLVMILDLMTAAGNSGGSRVGALPACEIAKAADLGQPNTSYHLKELWAVGLVHRRRHGRQVYYSIAPEATERMRAFLSLQDVGNG